MMNKKIDILIKSMLFIFGVPVLIVATIFQFHFGFSHIKNDLYEKHFTNSELTVTADIDFFE